MQPAQRGDNSFWQHLRAEQEPMTLRRDGQPVHWSDEALHRAAYAADPTLSALYSLAQGVTAWQRARILYQLLERSRHGMSEGDRKLLDRVGVLLLVSLNPDTVLTVFLALRRARANHKHTTRAIASYLLNHPDMEDMAAKRCPAVQECLEHALGKATARASMRHLIEPDGNREYVRRHLLRFTWEPARVEALAALLGRGKHEQEPTFPESADYRRHYTHYETQLEGVTAPPETVTATNRGEIASLLTHLYRGGSTPALVSALEAAVARASVRLPRFHGKLVMVLDASSSMRGYGERAYCTLAQSFALERVLQQRCDAYQVLVVGGFGWPPAPEGPTDLAKPLLDALEHQPDLVVIVSDGYENCYEGDLARVVATLPCLGVETPVVFCHSKFSPADDLTLRRPARNLPELAFWHQDDFTDLLLNFHLLADTPATRAGLRAFLLRRLE